MEVIANGLLALAIGVLAIVALTILIVASRPADPAASPS